MTKKQRQIIVLVSQGMKNREISAVIGLSEYGTKNQIRRIFDELGFHNRLELALWQVKQESTTPS
jgi:DNA-binding NarL/FixJ family response regulator